MLKARHADDHEQDDEHHGLRELNGAEEVEVIARPVTHIKAATQVAGDLHHQAGSLQRIIQREADSAHLVAELEEPRGIGDVHQGEAPVELVHSRFEYPRDEEAAHAWHDTGRRCRALRRDHDHLPAYLRM